MSFYKPTSIFLKHISATLLLLVASATSPALAQKASPETEAVKSVITTFFDGMRRGDSTMVRRTLAPAAVFHGFGGKSGQTPTLEY